MKIPKRGNQKPYIEEGLTTQCPTWIPQKYRVWAKLLGSVSSYC